MSNSLKNICFRCGRGCSGLSAAFDPRGRLLCPACASISAVQVEDSGEIAILPAASPEASRAPCPFCGAPLVLGTPTCPACGKLPSVYKVARERDPDLDNLSPIPCTKCSYDLRGLPSLTCPECGTVNTRQSRSRQYEETSREILLNEIRKPAIIGGASLLVVLAVLAASKGPAEAGVFLALYPIRVVVASGAFLLCGFLDSGVDPPIWLIALRMAAIVPAVQLLHAVCGATGVPGLGTAAFAGGTLVFAFLLVDLFEMEISETWLVILVNSLAWVALSILIAVLT